MIKAYDIMILSKSDNGPALSVYECSRLASREVRMSVRRASWSLGVGKRFGHRDWYLISFKEEYAKN